MNKNSLLKTGQILFICFVLIFTLGCQNDIPWQSNKDGNVTIKIDPQTERTLMPVGITDAAIFERIEIEFTKGDDLRLLTINKGETEATTNLDEGTWDISAKAYIQIGDTEYEAARANTSVTVSSSGHQNVDINLRTGIFDGAPGLFTYNFPIPAGVDQAELELNPFGGGTGGINIDLLAQANGTSEIAPGYYMLTVKAKDSENKIAIWNNLVHIYSGQETFANYELKAADFFGSQTLSGVYNSGELDGIRIQNARIAVYGDSSYITLIANADIPLLTKAPNEAYFKGNWTVTIPGSYSGKTVYFAVEENLGEMTFTRLHAVPVSSSASENTGTNLNGSFTWSSWVNTTFANEDAISFTVAPDGTITVTTNEQTNSFWEIQHLNISYLYPIELLTRYAFEFDAWTDSEELDLNLVYFYNHADFRERDLDRYFSIDNERQTYSIISSTNTNGNVLPQILFECASGMETNTFHIKMNKIVRSSNYTPPQVGDDIFSAIPTDTGIRFKIKLKDMPEGITQIQVYNQKNGTHYEFWGIHNVDEIPDYYEFIYPFVNPDEEYSFRLQYGGISMAHQFVTITATGGRGDFYFANSSELALINEGNTLAMNRPIEFSEFGKNDILDMRLKYTIVAGTSWNDPNASWCFEAQVDAEDGANNTLEIDSIDLTDLSIIPEWVNTSNFMGRTSFATFGIHLVVDDEDLYITKDYLANEYNPDRFGTFRTENLSSAPFTYPNSIANTFTATAESDGLRFTVDLNQLVPYFRVWDGGYDSGDYDSLEFIVNNYDTASLYIWHGEWNYDYGKFYYDSRIISFIYPFVEAGETYNIRVNYGSTGMTGNATVTAAGGLGDLYITNSDSTGLIYNSNTKTMSYTNTPVPSVTISEDTPGVDNHFWRWAFVRGRSWGDTVWIGEHRVDEPSPLVINNEINQGILSRLSGRTAFIELNYLVVYDGLTFESGRRVPQSSPFTFPLFDPLVQSNDSWIRTSFGIDSNINLYYDSWVNKGSQLNLNLYGEKINPETRFDVHINGVKQENVNIEWNWYDDWNGDLQLQLTIDDELETERIYYGLVVVTINGTPYSREFSFLLYE